MFGSTILDVAIGMIFVYLLLSLLCSAIKEYIEAKFLQYRSQNLWKGIQLLLNGTIIDDLKKPDMNVTMPTVSSPPVVAPPAAASPDNKLDLASLLYQHGLVRALYQDAEQLPSYIPSRTFALALWNMASEATGNKGVRDIDQIKDVIHDYIPNRQLAQALYTMLDEADGNFERALKNVEDWYDASMDRVSGWYKRHTQYVLLAIGLITAIFINADSVNIAKALSQDKTLRDTIVAASADTLRNPPASLATPTPPPDATSSGGASSTNANRANGDNANANNANSNNANSNNANAARAAHRDNGGANNANANTTNTNAANANAANANTAGTKAEAAATPAPDTPEGRIAQVRKELYNLGLPLGWVRKDCTEFEKFKDGNDTDICKDKALKNKDDLRRVPNSGSEWALKFLGLLLTGLAISQGAPFWFDLLNKFMVIRSTVKPKEKSPDEASKDKTKPNPKIDTHDGAVNGKT